MATNFGERLRLAMERKHWSQAKLAEEAKLDPGAVSRHLDRVDAPRIDSVRKYSDALGVAVDWLAYGRESTDVPSDRAAESPLEEVLRVFCWPQGLSIDVMDAIARDARAEAKTAEGRVRPVSIWRAWIEREISRRSPKTEPRQGVVRGLEPGKRR